MTHPAIVRTAFVSLWSVVMAAAFSMTGGCGQSGGWAYFLGIGRKTKIEAHFTLPEGKVLVLVDDPGGKVHWPRARDLLGRYLGEELLTHRAAESIISPESLARFRQTDAAFETYAAHRIGRKLGADTVICANPVAQTQTQAVEMVRKGGRVVLFGGLPKADPMVTVDANRIHYGEIQFVGSFSYHPAFHELALDAIRRKLIPSDLLITHTFSLDRVAEAFHTADSGQGLKVMVTM